MSSKLSNDPEAVARTRDERLNRIDGRDPFDPKKFCRRWNATLSRFKNGNGAVKKLGDGGVILIGERDVTGPERPDGLWMHARWVFGVEKREMTVQSYSFTLTAPGGAVEPGFRYDYIQAPIADSVSHPACHITPITNREIRLPAAFMSPDELMWLFVSVRKWW
jgi:hypothetical protein